MNCTSDCVHELGRAGAKRGQATRLLRRVIMSLRIPRPWTINERELGGVKSETMDTEKRTCEGIIYLFDLNNKGKSSLLHLLSFPLFLELQFLPFRWIFFDSLVSILPRTNFRGKSIEKNKAQGWSVFRRGDSRGWRGVYERLEFVRKERLEAGDDPPPRERND